MIPICNQYSDTDPDTEHRNMHEDIQQRINQLEAALLKTTQDMARMADAVEQLTAITIQHIEGSEWRA